MRRGGRLLLLAALAGLDPAIAGPLDATRDCRDCPEMLQVPAGRFAMGSPIGEPGHEDDEEPQREIGFGHPFALSRTEITRGQYAAFATATGREPPMGCFTQRIAFADWEKDPHGSWRDPGFAQTDDHPVVCVSWDDARAYISWLNQHTSGGYRLPSEAEWEYAARAGSTGHFYNDEGVARLCDIANIAGAETSYDWRVQGCADGVVQTAPVGRYRANRFGFHDMIGNVREWVRDCKNSSLDRIGPDGSADETGACEKRVVRGGAWMSDPVNLRLADRYAYRPAMRGDFLGFRVARTLPRTTRY